MLSHSVGGQVLRPCVTPTAPPEPHLPHRMFTEHLALMAREECVPGPRGSESMRETVHGTTPKAVHRQETESPCPMQRPVCLSWSFGSQGTLQDHPTSRGYRSALREHRPSLCFLLESLQLTSTFHQVFIWSPKFCNCYQEDTSKSPGVESSRVYDCRPTELYIFENLKRC